MRDEDKRERTKGKKRALTQSAPSPVLREGRLNSGITGSAFSSLRRHDASFRSQFEVIELRLLLRNKGDRNAKGSSECTVTPLHLAATQGHARITELLKYGVDANAQAVDESTLLHREMDISRSCGYYSTTERIAHPGGISPGFISTWRDRATAVRAWCGKRIGGTGWAGQVKPIAHPVIYFIPRIIQGVSTSPTMRWPFV